MKLLFVDYFNISVSCCVLILFVVLARFLLKGAPKRMLCVLWALVFLRLLLPFGLESDLSLRPHIPAVTDRSTGIYFESALMPEGQIPELIPHTNAAYAFGDWMARIDYVTIAAWIWGIGCGCMLLYAVISYVRLRRRLRNAVRLRENIYAGEISGGGFLLGYFQPRIYVNAGLDANTAELVIRHEMAHKKYGDNWLKLAGYVCLGLHWYNPLVWLAYVLLCRDIEYACDAQVIKDLSLEERKAYSVALLFAGKQPMKHRGGVLPFGEGGLRRRISTVLRYRKPALWICVAAAVAVAVFGIFFVTDPASDQPPMCKELTELIGQPRETVVEALDIQLQENAYTANTGYYDTPVTVEYQGVEFRLILGFSRVDDSLWGFQYVATYQNDQQQAARDTVAVAKQLQATYGKAAQSDNKRTLWLSDITETAVLEKFENPYLAHEGISHITGNWQLSDTVGQETRDYWEQMTQSEQWQTYWDGRPVSLAFSMDLSAWNDSDSNTAYLCLDYDTKYSFQP